MHDIGKINISREILNKKNAFSKRRMGNIKTASCKWG